MAEPVWGLLEKSQVDNETIEEAIDRLITAHLADAGAHAVAGESLEVHKTQVTVDHPADSIIEDKVKDGQISLQKLTETKFIIITCFESLDGWYDNSDANASITAGIGAAYLETDNVNGNKAILVALPSAPGMSFGIDFAKNPFFQARVYVPQVTDQTIYFGCGNAAFPGAPPTTEYMGFKIVDGLLYAVHSNAVVETTTQIMGINLGARNLYRAKMDSGTDIKFYINGVLKATHAANLPVGEEDAILVFMIRADANAVKELDLVEALFSHDW